MEEASKVEDIVEISISTRPDCIRQDYLEAFYEFSSRTGIEVSIEPVAYTHLDVYKRQSSGRYDS